jgi:anti-sigma regulatory factor (Ser/Thr protein kinase)
LDATSTAARHARRLVGQWLEGIECADETKHHVVLAVSELVSNAVIHARSPSTLSATIEDDRLRIEVDDQDPTTKPQRVESPGSIGGFGLRIVDEIGDAWGWSQLPRGKRIWLEVRC